MRLAGSRLTPRPHRLAYRAVIKGPGMSNSNYYAALLGALDINDSSPRSSSAVEAFPGSRLKKKKSFSSASPTTENGHVEASSTAVATGDGAATASSTASSSVLNSEAAKPSRSMAVADALVWIDLEMTGLDPETDTILEIACLVTNGDLTMTIEGPSLVVHQPEEVLLNMNDWCKEHHGKSGLTQRVRGSSTTMAQAEDAVLAFITNYVPDAKRAQLAGNSVHNDRVFLMKYMPKITEHLDHRIVDVSSVSELCKRWFPREFRNRPRKGNKHTALVDIKESVHELRYYKQHVFKKK